jgi:predicted RNA binding protein YcfA (HicA-like mRNA interferase family)
LPRSSRLPRLSWRKVLKALGKIGFVRQSGSHVILRNQEGRRISVPRHDPLGRGLLMEIITEAGITKDEFLGLL